MVKVQQTRRKPEVATVPRSATSSLVHPNSVRTLVDALAIDRVRRCRSDACVPVASVVVAVGLRALRCDALRSSSTELVRCIQRVVSELTHGLVRSRCSDAALTRWEQFRS